VYICLPERVDLSLVAIRLAAFDSNLYTLERPDGGPLPPAEAGAHIGFVLPNGLERQYSLIHAEMNPYSYTVCIKRNSLGRGGSKWIHDHLRVGMRLPIDPPRNNFPLNEDAAQTILFAGGIGITPIYCMVRRLQDLGRDFTLHYSCRSRADAAFLHDLACLANVHFHFDDEAGGAFLPVAELVAAAPSGAHLYCCGPTPMLASFEEATFDRPPEEAHVEHFTQKYASAMEGGFIVQLAKSGRELVVPPGKTILQVLRDAGIDVTFSCEEGICGACETRVISGEPDHRDALLGPDARRHGNTMMICCSGSKHDRLVLDL
jgi:ferredoxin-NADP reductase